MSYIPLNSVNMYLQSDNSSISNGESNKIFNFRSAIEALPDKDIIVGLTDFELANTMYNINEGFNSITIDNQVITLIPKNYTIEFLIMELNDLFEANATLKAKNLGVSYDINSFKLTFTADSNFIINSSTMELEIGLEQQLPTVNSKTYEANNTIYLGGISSVYVEIRNFSFSNIDSRTNGSIDHTLAKINMKKNNGFFTFYNQPEHIYFKLNNREINQIHIVLTDDKNRELVLNGGQFSLTLSFHFTQKQDTINDFKYYLDENSKVEKLQNLKK